MSSIEANPNSTIPPPSSSSGSPTSRSSLEKSETPILNPAGTEKPLAAAEKLLSAVKDVRQIIRLIQCGVCSGILQEPATLPCGRSLCKQCIPATHIRTNISWPATTGRLHGFTCPFEDCKKEHALGDCSVDVTLNKALMLIRTAIEQDRNATDASDISTHIAVQDAWDMAGLSSLKEKEDEARVLKGGRVVSTYTLAEMGKLGYDREVSYTPCGAEEDEVSQTDVTLFTRLKESARTEMDCQVCYALYLDPLTTACGHTFCRACLHRVLDHSEHCPICRRELLIQPQLNPTSFPSNQRLTTMINEFWADTVALRAQTARLEQQAQGEYDVPLFVCTMSFPTMPTFLHVFEPRYRLMIRRAMDGNRTFGMVLYTQPTEANGRVNFLPIGTLLRIVNIEFFPDGRSLLETVGVSRFKVLKHALLDGYMVGNIEKVDDVSVAEEEANEVSETMRSRGVQNFARAINHVDGGSTNTTDATTTTPVQTPQPTSRPSPASLTMEELDGMATRELLEFGIDFVRRMRSQSVAWLTTRVLAIYGDCPNDPARFPWWFASILPVSDEEKYRLLGTSSVRERLKTCCRWIVEWESSRW
ncbi:ATP-dependent protease La domain-containing protein [Apiospora saccharicola]|uniref:ATP-dependent protease La domain-containing protein n=1 Tax=Apiospora saccharicola TaxID=335842 RepID=A0ABR1WDB1_9PEZI